MRSILPVADATIPLNLSNFKDSGFIVVAFLNAAGAAVVPTAGSLTFVAIDVLGIRHPLADNVIIATEVDPASAVYTIPSWGSPISSLEVTLAGITGNGVTQVVCYAQGVRL